MAFRYDTTQTVSAPNEIITDRQWLTISSCKNLEKRVYSYNLGDRLGTRNCVP